MEDQQSRKQFGDYIKTHLANLGMSPSELARRADLSREHIRRLMIGESGSKPESVKAIANALQRPENEALIAAGLVVLMVEEEKSQYDKFQGSIPENKGVLEKSFEMNIEILETLNDLRRKMDELLKKSDDK